MLWWLKTSFGVPPKETETFLRNLRLNLTRYADVPRTVEERDGEITVTFELLGGGKETMTMPAWAWSRVNPF